MLRKIALFLLPLIAVVSINMGIEYVTEGYGLHPLIAFSIACLSFIVFCLSLQTDTQPIYRDKPDYPYGITD